MQFDVVHEEKLRLIFLTAWRRQVRGPVGHDISFPGAWQNLESGNTTFGEAVPQSLCKVQSEVLAGPAVFMPKILYHFDQLFSHRSQGFLKWRVGPFVTGHITFWSLWHNIFGPFRVKIGNSKENLALSHPDSGWRDAHLFMAVTSHEELVKMVQ